MLSQINFEVPNLCKNTSLLSIVLAAQLTAIVITIAGYPEDFLTRLGLVSLYSQWVALSAAAVLCWLRSSLNRQTKLTSVCLVLIIILICFLTAELLAQFWVQQSSFNASQFWHHLAIVLVLSLVALRIFALLSLLDRRGRIEMEARVQALQSRIRPHFLFNSLNTIAELTATQPAKAEEAIDSLSLLFRAGLESESKFHTLESELNLCRRYLGLERWRLDDRLNVSWSIEVKNPPAYVVPKLILQPLIENAVVHGEQKDGSVTMSIDVRETRKDLSIVVENNKSNKAANNPGGHGIAVANIKDRLFMLYDDQETFRVRESGETYSVLMRFPKRRPIGE